ncbi:MAG: response regulator [Bacteroidota bacterium]
MRRISSSPDAAFAGLRVLVADDSEINRGLAINLLTMLGCVTSTATNGYAAVEACQKNDFDLILMDCRMPGLDGFAATRAIRSFEQTINAFPTPIIALTVSPLPSTHEQCIQAGMDDCVAKPIRIATLKHHLEACLPKADAPPAIRRAA